MEISIQFTSDEKGYFDRQCPNSKCEYVFKIFMDDWKEKVSNDVVYCPMCGCTATSNNWNTSEQNAEIRKRVVGIGMDYVQNELDRIFGNLAKNNRSNKYINISYNPGKRTTFNNNPIGQREEWEVDITCDMCGTRYSVIGSAYFCPCCGYNAVEKVFDESIDTIEKMLSAKEEMFTTFSEKYGKDKADTMCRTLTEGSLADVVSAFQKLAESRFKSISKVKVKPNDFQSIERGNMLFLENCGKGYGEWLAPKEIEYLNLMFQRRHILEHNNGLVDERYIIKSGDNIYKVGQRVIVKDTDISELIVIVKKLGDGLKILA